MSAPRQCQKRGRQGTPMGSLSALGESSRERRRCVWKPSTMLLRWEFFSASRTPYGSCIPQETWLAGLLRDHITDLINQLRYFPKQIFPIFLKKKKIINKKFTKSWLVKLLKMRHIFWSYSVSSTWCLQMSQKHISLWFPVQICHLLPNYDDACHKIVHFSIVQWFWSHLARKKVWKLSLTLKCLGNPF